MNCKDHQTVKKEGLLIRHPAATERSCLLMYDVKPRTGLYAVEMDVSEGYALPKLTPIV